MINTTMYQLAQADCVFVDGHQMVSFFTEAAEAADREALEAEGLEDHEESILIIETQNEHGNEVFHRFLAELPITYGEDTDDTARAYDRLGQCEVVITTQAVNTAPWEPA